MVKSGNLVRFDWAMKRLLRDKADYCVVEGLLTVLLERPIHIKSLLESESNKDSNERKLNRVDLLAEDDSGELMIFEIQNDRQLDYFHRMVFGTSQAMTEYIGKGEPYAHIRKIYSIHIVYFTIGQGKDYVYKGTTRFVGLHDSSDELRLSEAQRRAFSCETPADIFPEYYLLRVDKFNDVARTPLDEWISFLKNCDIPSDATAPGLREARERLNLCSLSEEERRHYYASEEDLHYEASIIEGNRLEGRFEGIDEGIVIGEKRGIAIGEERGIAKEKFEIARRLKSMGADLSVIAQATGLSENEVSKT